MEWSSLERLGDGGLRIICGYCAEVITEPPAAVFEIPTARMREHAEECPDRPT